MPERPDLPEKSFSAIDDAIAALRAGGLVIVVDAEERENEGDFICAAENITPETISFMLRRGSGVLCAPMSGDVADRLSLKPIVSGEQTTAPHGTPFLTPVDHIDAGTGVSLANRARTLHALSNHESRAADFVAPGHINPLCAREGGVLRRAGHTEATVDLLQMAGMKPVGVLIEILSENGDGMAEYAELKQISEEFDIPIISIAALIHHRRLREQLVRREVEVTIPTSEYGSPRVICYSVAHENQEPLALVWGDPEQAETPPLVRMHSSCFTGDLIDSLRCDCGDQLRMAMSMIHGEGCGAVVYLPQEGRGIGLKEKLRAYELQDNGYDTVEANLKLGYKADHRDYMIGLQILKDLGLREVRLLTNNPKKANAFPYTGMDLKLVEQVPIVAPLRPERERYMQTKRDKLGHRLPSE